MSAAIVGLILDIVGVVVLGWALGFASNVQLNRISGTYFELNTYALEDLVKQAFDTRIGLMVLCAGFSLQIVGSIFPDCIIQTEYAVIFLALIFVSLTAYFHDLRDVFIQRRVAEIIATKLPEEESS